MFGSLVYSCAKSFEETQISSRSSVTPSLPTVCGADTLLSAIAGMLGYDSYTTAMQDNITIAIPDVGLDGLTVSLDPEVIALFRRCVDLDHRRRSTVDELIRELEKQLRAAIDARPDFRTWSVYRYPDESHNFHRFDDRDGSPDFDATSTSDVYCTGEHQKCLVRVQV